MKRSISRHVRHLCLVLSLWASSACFEPVDEGANPESPPPDAGAPAATDAGARDGGASDGGARQDAGESMDAGSQADGGDPDADRVLIFGAMVTVCNYTPHESYTFAFSETEVPGCDQPLAHPEPPYRLELTRPLEVGPLVRTRGLLYVENQPAVYWSGNIDSVNRWLVTGRIDTRGSSWNQPRHDRFVAVVCPLRLHCYP